VGKFLQRNKLAKVPYPQDIVTALVRTELQKPIARQKGWILSGFPLDKDQCTIFKNYQLNPHLVVILDDDQDRYLENYL
jgi:adenylate kinase family enzyme